jgi:hypothetical protein
VIITPKARLCQILGAACVEALGICISDGAIGLADETLPDAGFRPEATKGNPHKPLIYLVGAAGFEAATTRISQTWLESVSRLSMNGLLLVLHGHGSP